MSDREKWKKLLPIIEAHVEGKEIEYKASRGMLWAPCSNYSFTGDPDQYRIKPAPNAHDYVAAQAECGIAVGDWVKVTRAAEYGEQGWINYWNPRMTKYVGEIGQVSRLTSSGLMAKFPNSRDNFQFPYFVLEKTDQPCRPFKDGKEFAAALSSQELPMVAQQCGECFVVSSIRPQGASICGALCYWDYLLKNYKFVDGSPCGMPIDM